jgi:hypothetical protein
MNEIFSNTINLNKVHIFLDYFFLNRNSRLQQNRSFAYVCMAVARQPAAKPTTASVFLGPCRDHHHHSTVVRCKNLRMLPVMCAHVFLPRSSGKDLPLASPFKFFTH